MKFRMHGEDPTEDLCLELEAKAHAVDEEFMARGGLQPRLPCFQGRT